MEFVEARNRSRPDAAVVEKLDAAKGKQNSKANSAKYSRHGRTGIRTNQDGHLMDNFHLLDKFNILAKGGAIGTTIQIRTVNHI